MADPLIINEIRSSRDAALDALAVSASAIADEIAQTTKTGPYLDQLTKRYQDLMNHRAAIWSAATDAVLSLPNVIAAAGTLNMLSAQMRTTSQELPGVTNVLAQSQKVLALGQQFSDVIGAASILAAIGRDPSMP